MNSIKRKQFNAVLPATACSRQMRAAIITLSVQKGVTIAEIQREAFETYINKSGILKKASKR